MQVSKPGGLPSVLRFEMDNGDSRMLFNCPCSAISQNVWATVDKDRAVAEARCPQCGVIIRLGVYRELLADHGQAGTGR